MSTLARWASLSVAPYAKAMVLLYLGVPRQPESPSGPKGKVNISLNPDLLKWLRARVGEGKEFASLSSGIEQAIAQMRERRTRKKAK